jgi:hypothetical protein
MMGQIDVFTFSEVSISVVSIPARKRQCSLVEYYLPVLAIEEIFVLNQKMSGLDSKTQFADSEYLLKSCLCILCNAVYVFETDKKAKGFVDHGRLFTSSLQEESNKRKGKVATSIAKTKKYSGRESNP